MLGVAVGNVTPITRYAPEVVVQVIVCAVTVPLFFTRSISFWPSVGVPEGAAMVKVPVAITSYWSELSPVGVTVPVVVTVLTRGVTRLLVSVSVVARPTSVSVLVGSVRVPVLTIVLKIGADSVGPVPSTTEPDPVLVVTPVPPEATARVPAKVIVPAPVTGPPEVVRPVVPPLTATLVTVPVAPFATLRVPVVIDRPVPRAMVPVVPPSDATVFAVVVKVPVVGSVREVAPLTVSVVAKAPTYVTDPPSVNVLDPLLTPVPPYVGAIKEPCQLPVPIVPTLVSDETVTPDARVLPVRVLAGAADKNANEPRVPPAPTLSVDPSAPAKVKLLLAASVFKFVIERTPVVLLIVRPLTLVAVAAPSVGVTSTGLVARTIEPEPVVAFPSAVREPVVGIITDVVPVVVTVSGNAPTVVTLPAMVIVFVPLFTPVPPEAPPSVPARVTAPVVAVDGVRPVSDVWKVATPDVPLALIVPALSDKPEPTTRPETVDPVDA